MAMVNVDRQVFFRENIAVLRAVFPYRGDKILYGVDRDITVKYALDVMEIANKLIGYRLQWTVRWAGD